MNNTLSKRQVNNLKSAIAVLHVKNISEELMDKKLGEIVNMLQYPEEELRTSWINSTKELLLNQDYKAFKEYIRKELAYLGDTNAINELNNKA